MASTLLMQKLTAEGSGESAGIFPQIGSPLYFLLPTQHFNAKSKSPGTDHASNTQSS